MTAKRPWNRFGIAGKLVCWFLIISLVPLVALMVLTQELSLGLMRQTVLIHLQALADQKARQIDVFAQGQKRHATTLSRLPVVTEALQGFGHGGGDAATRARADGDFRVSLAAFADFAEYRDLLLFSPQGELLFSVARRIEAGSRLDSGTLAGSELAKSFEAALRLGDAQMSGIDLKIDPGDPAAFIAAPVLRQGNLLGVMVAQISSRDIWRELTSAEGLGETGETVLGEMRDGALDFVAPLRNDPNLSFHHFMGEKPKGGFPLQQAVMGGAGSGETVDYRHVQVIAVWRYLPAMHWGMVVKMDRAEALALVARQQQLLITIGFLTLMGVLLLALMASRSLTMPIRALTGVVRKMSAGDLYQHVAVETNDELGELGASFNRMTADMRNVYATIESQVHQRTRELQSSYRDLEVTRDSMRKFFQAVECSPVSVIITDNNGIIEYVNPHFTDKTGYAASEVVGRLPGVIGSGRTPRAVYDQLWSTIRGGGEWRGEFLNRRKSGELYWEAASISAVSLPGGAITHFVSIQDDISARKEFEEHLRTAKDAAEHANRAKSEFLAVMSHEIRTPMNGILGMTQLLLDTPLSGKQRDYLDTICQSGEALLTLLNDILDFSKLEAGRVEIENVDFDIFSTVASVVELMSPRAHEKKIRISAEISPEVPRFLSGDPARLRQILLNLIGNAVKFTELGSVRVRVEPAGLGAFRFSVTDTGIGIPQDVRSRLFQSFSQADSSITRRYGGSGLGLVISQRLVVLLGGQIGCDSIAGEGSVFWFVLPYSLGKEPATSRPGLSSGSALPRLRVLLAEDNGVNRKVATALLEKWGHRVTAVVDGREAVDAVRAHPFDLVLMDMQMPELDGLEATRLIRAMPAPACNLPIVALTANAMRADQTRCLEAGMDDYISKPIEHDRLYAALERVCERRVVPAR